MCYINIYRYIMDFVLPQDEEQELERQAEEDEYNLQELERQVSHCNQDIHL